MIADPEGPSFITCTVGRRQYAGAASVSHDPKRTQGAATRLALASQLAWLPSVRSRHRKHHNCSTNHVGEHSEPTQCSRHDRDDGSWTSPVAKPRFRTGIRRESRDEGT